MQIPAIDNAIEVCRKHLDNTSSRNTEVESYLTRYLVVMICAAFEERLEELVFDRARQLGDAHVSAFVKSAAAQLIRSIRVNELSGFLSRFGNDRKEEFQKTITADTQQAYDTIIAHRHGTAHSSGGSMTLTDLELVYSKCLGILEAFATALGLTPKP